MVKESASKVKQDNTTQMILVKNDNNRQGSLEELSILSYTPIEAYRTAVLGCRDQLRVLGLNGIIRYYDKSILSKLILPCSL